MPFLTVPLLIFCRRHGRQAHDNALLTVPLPIFCKRHGHARHDNALFDRAFVVFLQKARSHSALECTFRPCLCHFLAKGTVTPDTITHFLTVPLSIFSKRHGHARHENALFDRAFVDFLQKARSRPTRERTFRPCLCRFLAKGTVAPDTRTQFLTVPLWIF